jgi:tRNA(Ile)-lysidine synthase TilS/MesJ
MALAHWFNITFNDNTSNKKLFFKLKFLHVDNTFLKEIYFNFDDSKKELLLDERSKKKLYLEELFKQYNFEYEIINLENVLEIEALNLKDLNKDELKNERKQKLKTTNFSLVAKYLKIYENISKAGSFETDFSKILTRNFIFYYSRLNDFNKLIFGNNGESLVSGAFSSIIKGRGFTTKEEIAYVDSRYLKGNPLILRPLKDFLDKEILLFNYMHKIDAIPDALEIDFVRFNHKNNIPFKGNTDNLVQSFFDNLQSRMGSTITTVLGTTEKLKEQKEIHKEDIQNYKTCEFCLSYVDQVCNILEIGSLDSIKNE